MTALSRRVAYGLGLASVLALAAGTPATAQPVQSAPAIVDTFVAVVTPRSADEITKDSERASALRAQAKQHLARAQEEVSNLESMIKARQVDLEAFEKHLDALDDDKNAKEIAAVRTTTVLLEKVLDLLELRKNMGEAEVSSAAATVALTEAQEELYSFEGRLVMRRTDRAGLAKKPGSAADVAALDLAIKEMEDAVLKLSEKMISRHEDAVAEEEDLLGHRRKLADAQNTFHNP
ncbi:MAG TPA: hypothetical protein VLT13_10780 [Bacteroidota bacterium]|nr:hypothetical protein [Bacteroidota bacterium]